MTCDEAIVKAYEEGWRVTNDGRVVTPKGWYKHRRWGNNKNNYYPGILLFGKKCLLHRLAGYCFYKEEMFKPNIVVRHLNGDKRDFSRKNIALGTQKDNIGDIPASVKSKRTARLSDEEVILLRKMRSEGKTHIELGKIFGIHNTTSCDICKRKTYKHLP